MAKWFVIADDLTGAAEIAGIAYRFGCSVRIMTRWTGTLLPGVDVVVVNADTRNFDSTQAAGQIRDMLTDGGYRNDMKLFMKTDSLLRGNVGGELLAALSATSYTSCVLVPANPSKQRTIRNGNYYVENTLLADTEYRHDPEYPRTSSDVAALLAIGSELVDTTDIDWEHSSGKILVPDISTADDTRALIGAHVQDDILAAGGADFFRELLVAMGPVGTEPARPGMECPGRKCFVFGSYADANRKALPVLLHNKYSMYEIPVPRENEPGSPANGDHWLSGPVEQEHNVVLKLQDVYIDNAAVRERMLHELINLAAATTTTSREPVHFLVTGGKTATLLCRKLNWDALTVVDVPGEGVTTLQNRDTEHCLTVKPGSYDWPDSLLK